MLARREVVVKNDGPETFVVAWVSMDFYKFGWVRDWYPMHIETTLDPKEAMKFDTINATRFLQTCDVNGVACHMFGANVEIKEIQKTA